jgi:hypothetical protein
MRTCECGQPRRPSRDSCADCARIDSWRVRQEQAPVRVTNVLRHEDWLSSYEIRLR